MKIWVPLLVILPAGLVVGILGARMIDPGITRENGTVLRPEADAPSGYFAPPVDDIQQDEAADPYGSDRRPDLDWDAEAWPADPRDDPHAARSGPYDYDDDYYSDGGSAFGDSDNSRTGDIGTSGAGTTRGPTGRPTAEAGRTMAGRGLGRGGADALAAADAAERAAGDAVRIARQGAPRPPVAARPFAPATRANPSNSGTSGTGTDAMPAPTASPDASEPRTARGDLPAIW